MSINFISHKDSNETRTMHTKSDNTEIMMSSKTDEIIEEPYIKESEFFRDSVDLLYYQLRKTSLKRNRSSYMDSPKRHSPKKGTINPKNSDNNCFQYALTVVISYQSIKKDLQRVSLIKPFISQYNCKEKNFFQHNHQKTGKSSNEITSQLLLMFYLCHTMLKK